jgi:F-type H+-transporting ATPase subunit b
VGPGEFLNINFFTALFTLLNTLALFFVLKHFLFQPVMKMIRDRQQEIDDMYQKAEDASHQAQKLQTEYEQKLNEAALTGERLVQEAVARGQSREEEILRQAETKAEAIRQKAMQDIAREKKKALNEAKDEISVIAIDIAGKVVGKNLSGEDQTRLVDDFIHRLGE